MYATHPARNLLALLMVVWLAATAYSSGDGDAASPDAGSFSVDQSAAVD